MQLCRGIKHCESRRGRPVQRLIDGTIKAGARVGNEQAHTNSTRPAILRCVPHILFEISCPVAFTSNSLDVNLRAIHIRFYAALGQQPRFWGDRVLAS
jgi:hypothetical protein